jgi:transcription antitermination factor NusG
MYEKKKKRCEKKTHIKQIYIEEHKKIEQTPMLSRIAEKSRGGKFFINNKKVFRSYLIIDLISSLNR